MDLNGNPTRALCRCCEFKSTVSRGTQIVDIEIGADKTIIKVLGLHKLWALKNRIELAQNSIKSVEQAGPSSRPPLWRAPGTYIPWLIVAGTYYGRRRKEFWDTTRRSKRIIIELENDEYTRVVVDVKDPVKTIRELRKAV